ncbi:MAG: hypothetical protein GXP43_00105 [bacterium]|nr:hypothetical protein [bacterium]
MGRGVFLPEFEAKNQKLAVLHRFKRVIVGVSKAQIESGKNGIKGLFFKALKAFLRNLPSLAFP